MFLTLWEFEVKPGSEELFEKAYGAEGEWVQAVPAGCAVSRDAIVEGCRRGENLCHGGHVGVARQAYEEFRAKLRSSMRRLMASARG